MKKKLLCAILASAACLLTVQSASAAVIGAGSQLNTGGTLTGLGATDLNLATGLDFTSGGPGAPAANPAMVLGVTGSGDLNVTCQLGATADSCGLIADILSFTGFSGDVHFFSGLPGGFNFQLNAPLQIIRAAGTADSLPTLILSGTGIISGGVFDPTAGIFTLVTQGGINTTFSASIVALAAPINRVPEPASTALFGLGVAGLMLARRKKSQQS